MNIKDIIFPTKKWILISYLIFAFIIFNIGLTDIRGLIAIPTPKSDVIKGFIYVGVSILLTLYSFIRIIYLFYKNINKVPSE